MDRLGDGSKAGPESFLERFKTCFKTVLKHILKLLDALTETGLRGSIINR